MPPLHTYLPEIRITAHSALSQDKPFLQLCEDCLAGDRRQSAGDHAQRFAARLMVNADIRKRVAELKEAQSQKSELSRDQVREFLTEVILMPAGKADEQSRLSQSYKVAAEVREIRMPDKLRAVERLAKLSGGTSPKSMSMTPAMSSRNCLDLKN